MQDLPKACLAYQGGPSIRASFAVGLVEGCKRGKLSVAS